MVHDMLVGLLRRALVLSSRVPSIAQAPPVRSMYDDAMAREQAVRAALVDAGRRRRRC